jgi:hypothetical protein
MTCLFDIEHCFDLGDPAGDYLGTPALRHFQKASGLKPWLLPAAFLASAPGKVRLSADDLE